MILILVWLFAWIGMALSHDLLHLVHLGEKSNVACAVCRVLDQPMATETAIASQTLSPLFYVVKREIRIDSNLCFSREFIESLIPRGPPVLLLS